VAKKKSSGSSPTNTAESTGRVSVIHLQGPLEEREWLTAANKKTHLPRATIVRLALREWGVSKGLPPYPSLEGGE